jgi:hypothetical protein
VTKETLDKLDCLVRLGQLETVVNQETRAHLEQLAILGTKDPRDLLDRQDHKVQQEHLETLDLPVPLVEQAAQDRQGYQETKGSQEVPDR